MRLRPRTVFPAAALLGCALFTCAASAADKKPGPEPAKPPAAARTGWVHAPYEMGDCDACHQGRDPKAPGELRGAVNDLCLGCHEEIALRLKKKAHAHEAIQDDCTACHDPHRSERRMLLIEGTDTLCFGCHQKIEKQASRAVKHDAVTSAKGCINCHDPHASDIDHLLRGLPRDLCLDCHGKDGLLDGDGKPLQNLGTLIADSPYLHAPVETGDCSACHQPHGSSNIRLLKKPYPPTFYTPFDPAAYELCFGCHEPANVTTERTTTLTAFRDGDRNLHYLHVNRQDRGRTCRACHEVHGSKQPHHIRDGVPYGSSGWVLKLQYSPAADGGTCAKTCHSARTYNRVSAVNVGAQ